MSPRGQAHTEGEGRREMQGLAEAKVLLGKLRPQTGAEGRSGPRSIFVTAFCRCNAVLWHDPQGFGVTTL